jgi:hypothetical protein
MRITNELIEQIADDIELEAFDPIDWDNGNNCPGKLTKSLWSYNACVDVLRRYLQKNEEQKGDLRPLAF